MKRLTGIILLSALCIFSACQQAHLEEPNANSENVGQNLQEVELSLIMPGGKTKTSLGLKDGDSYPVYWEEGDVITLPAARMPHGSYLVVIRSGEGEYVYKIAL